MITYPRAFRFRRVPAAPPRMVTSPTKVGPLIFQFNRRDCRGKKQPQEWKDFLTLVGSASVPYEQTNLAKSVTPAVRHSNLRGRKVEGKQDKEGKVTLVVHPLAKEMPETPRISAKLAATFPWKMRKHLKKP